MDTLIKVTDKTVEYVCKVMLVIQLLVVSGVVFGRYVFSYSPAWGEELALFAMVWLGLLSASTRVRDDSHLSLTFMDNYLPPRAIKIRDALVMLATALFGLFLLIQGANLVDMTRNNTLPGMGISSSILYAAVPVAGLAIVIQIIARLRDLYGSK